MGTDIVAYQLQQRDHLLQVARAMSARLEPREVLGVVVRSAVQMTGGRAGAIAIREDRADGIFDGDRAPSLERGSGPRLRIVASYHLEERFVDYVGDAVLQPEEREELAGDRSGADQSARIGSEAEGPPSPGGSLARWYQDVPLERFADGEAGPRRVLTIPLELRGETIGQIVVLRDDTATIFSPLDDDLLRAFADQAAVAIQNALLHARVRRKERQLAAVVEDSAAGIILLDGGGRAVTINPAAARFLGRSTAGSIGKGFETLVHLLDESGRPVPVDLPKAAGETITPRGRLVGDGIGDERWVQVSITPQLDETTGVDGYVVAITDLTAWREAERAKSAFLAGLSHELKTPLALIRGFAETLADSRIRHEHGFREQALGVILDETARLTEIVDRLLLAARIQAGAFRLQLDTVDVGALVGRLVEDLRLTAPERVIEFDRSHDLPVITADAERLREVFAELIRNALKYAPPEEPIQVVAAPAEGDGSGGVRVRVIDRGRPIDGTERERIFDRFYRGDERGNGTGLGLFMARAITRAHGGDVSAAGAGETGNVFEVVLPISPPQGAREGPTMGVSEGPDAGVAHRTSEAAR